MRTPTPPPSATGSIVVGVASVAEAERVERVAESQPTPESFETLDGIDFDDVPPPADSRGTLDTQARARAEEPARASVRPRRDSKPVAPTLLPPEPDPFVQALTDDTHETPEALPVLAASVPSQPTVEAFSSQVSEPSLPSFEPDTDEDAPLDEDASRALALQDARSSNEPHEPHDSDESHERRARMTSLVTPDEMSIPPVGDLSVEPVAERFFSEGELGGHGATDDAADDAWDAAQDKAQRKTLPHVVERRARFSRYVTWAVGVAAVLCLAAVARSTVTGRAPRAVAAVQPAAATELVAPVVKAAEPVVKAAPAPEPAAAAPSAPAATATEPAAAADAAPAADAKSALQEKNDARRSLERNKLADAIAAGERSVALDATDGEAWLLLGAAYQEKGNLPEARRAYAACVKEGKRGPIGECRQMLR